MKCRGKMISPEVFIRLFFLTLHLSVDMLSLSSSVPTRQTGETLHKQPEALAATPMHSHPGRVTGDQGWLPSPLSQRTPDLSLWKSNSCPQLNT